MGFLWSEKQGTDMKGTAMLFVCLFFQMLLTAKGSYTVVVPFDEEVCVILRTPGGAKSLISGSYDVLDDSPSHRSAVSVYLHDSSKEVFKSSPSDTEGTFSVQGSGRFEFCILNDYNHDIDDYYNSMDDDDALEVDRVVGFSVRVTPLPRGLEGEDEGPDDQKTSEILEKVVDIQELLADMEDHQDYVRSREAKHRDLVEATFKRVVRWTIIEALVLLLVAASQVLYLRKFFERKTYL